MGTCDVLTGIAERGSRQGMKGAQEDGDKKVCIDPTSYHSIKPLHIAWFSENQTAP